MNNKIQVLPENIANQIAAGEVIQRPASVVKELLENALDAEASEIKLFIQDGGKTNIQVIDNGMGMSDVDAKMCFEKHATSKIKTTKDLLQTYTMGFRGEALSSIASIAQVTLSTQMVKKEIGTKIRIEGGKFLNQEPINASVGTSISVKNLFFNVPTRRNFLKSNAIEMKYIIEIFQRIAMSKPDIQFTLYQNDKEVYQLPATKLSHRIVHIFGKEYQKQLIPCQEETENIRIKGYVGKPQYAKKNRAEQFFFVNRRFIKSHYLNHAVKNAFEGLLSLELFPFYVLCIEIDAKHIDFNIHPNKIEIKFENEKMVYSIIKACIQKALAIHNILPAIAFEQDAPISHNMLFTREKGEDKHYVQEKKQQNYVQFKNSIAPANHVEEWHKWVDKLNQKEVDGHFVQEDSQEKMVTYSSKANSTVQAQQENIHMPPLEVDSDYTFIQFNTKYIIATSSLGLVIVDQQAAHERILYEKYLKQIKLKNTVQKLLLEQEIHLSIIEKIILTEAKEDIEALGFCFTIAKNVCIITGYPTEIAVQEVKNLMEKMLMAYKEDYPKIKRRAYLAKIYAKYTSIKHGKRLTIAIMQNLISTLWETPNNQYSLEGKKIFCTLSDKSIGKLIQEG